MAAHASKNPPPIMVVDLRHVRTAIPGNARANAVRALRVARKPEVPKKAYETSSVRLSASRTECSHDKYRRPKIPPAVVRSHDQGKSPSMTSSQRPDACHPPKVMRLCENYHEEDSSAPPSIFQRSQAFLDRKESKIGRLRADLLEISKRVPARRAFTPDRRCFFPRQSKISIPHDVQPRIRRASGYNFSPQRREERFRRRSESRRRQREEEADRAKELDELTFRPQLCSPRATGSFLLRQRLWEHAKNAKREEVENALRQQARTEEEYVMRQRDKSTTEEKKVVTSDRCVHRTANTLPLRHFYDENQRWIQHRDAVLEKVREDQLKLLETHRAKRCHSAPCSSLRREMASCPTSARSAATVKTTTTSGSCRTGPTTNVLHNSDVATPATDPSCTKKSNSYHNTPRRPSTPSNPVSSIACHRYPSALCVHSHEGMSSYLTFAKGASRTKTRTTPGSNRDGATPSSDTRITTEGDSYHNTASRHLSPRNAIGSLECGSCISFTYEDYEETIRHIQILRNHAARNT